MNHLPKQCNKFLLKFFSQYWYCCFAILLTNIILSACLPLLWFVAVVFIDRQQFNDLNQIKYIAGLIVSMITLHGLSSALFAYISPELRRLCRKLCFAQIFKNNYLFFKKSTSIEIERTVSRLSKELVLLFKSFLYIVSISFVLISTMCILASISKFFVVILAFWWVLSFAACGFFGKLIIAMSFKISAVNENFSKTAREIIRSYIDVRIANKLSAEDKLLKCRSVEILGLEKKVEFFMIYVKFTLTLITIVSLVAFLRHLISIMDTKHIPTYNISFLLILGGYIYYLTTRLIKIFINAIKQLRLIKMGLKFLTRYGVEYHTDGENHLQITNGKIEFKKVTLRYHENENSFKDKTLSIEPGKRVALVGLSGSGKTSFSYMIPRLIRISSGKIFIDGQDISQVSAASLNKAVSFLSYKPRLFKRTIRENIAYGCHEYSDDELEEAVTKAGCHDFIMNLEKGYDTVVGSAGGNLTQGQKYRILIARAILKNAPIVLVDEPDFDIDAVSTKKIKEALNYLFEGKTAIIIAHWLETLEKADRILVFEKGTIVEDGTHKELLRYDDVYASLWRMHDGSYLPATFDR